MIVIDEHTRSLSGLILKNNIKARYRHLPREVINYVKFEALTCMGDPSSLIRATVGILLASLMHEGELQQWPELFDILLTKLDSENYYECEGAFSILQKVIEDSADSLDCESYGRQLNSLITKFFQFFTHQNSKLRSYALSCVNNFIINRTQIMMPYVDLFIQVCQFN